MLQHPSHRRALAHRALLIAMLVTTLAVLGRPTAAEPEYDDREVDIPDHLMVERVTAAVPFPRGLAIVDGKLYVLARGRVRGAGGVTATIDDKAGTIFEVDPTIAEPIDRPVSDAVASNGEPFALPTEPPFKLWNREADPPESDHETDRPYCGLAYDAATHSFYICAFSGVDMPRRPGRRSFSKNTTDAIHRYDTRTNSWHVVEQHAVEGGGNYPHHDPRFADAPHGWLNGPDNCYVVGRWLYGVAKDNSLLVRYDLSAIRDDPNAGPPPSYWTLGSALTLRETVSLPGVRAPLVTHREVDLQGHSMIAARDRYLYLGYRTASVIVRIPLDEDNVPVQPIVGELVARFKPYDPTTGKSANLTDMKFGPGGRLFVISAQPARVYAFTPDPSDVYDARDDMAADGRMAWAALDRITGEPRIKAENVLVDAAGRVYVTTGDAYGHEDGLGGVVYRLTAK